MKKALLIIVSLLLISPFSINALSKDELSELNEALLFDEDTFLRRLIKYRLKEKTVKQSNKSISLLLKQYCDKKSKCVVSSRRELQNRYPYQSQQCQRHTWQGLSVLHRFPCPDPTICCLAPSSGIVSVKAFTFFL